MNLDKLFVRRVLEGGVEALVLARKRGLGAGLLYGEGKNALEWAEGYLSAHGELPSPQLVEANLGLVLDAEDAALPFLQEEILKRALFNVLREGMEIVTAKMEARDPQAAYLDMVHLVEEARKVGLAESKVESLLALGEEVIEAYERAKAGETGILTPWPSVNDMTGGMWPEELWGVIARPSVGKTFFLTLMARYAWVTNARVLIASTEMSKKKMAFRFFACHLRLPYRPFRKGKLGDLVETQMRDKIRELSALPNLAILGGDFDMSVDGIEEAVRDYKPTVLFVDGAYLLKFRTVKGARQDKDRHSRVSEVMDELKRMGKRHELPVVFTSQFNREAKKNDKAGADLANVGITDVVGWNSDNLFALIQDDEMKAQKQLTVKTMKLREGEPQDVHLRWDFEAMDFGEEGHTADAIGDVGPNNMLKKPMPPIPVGFGEAPTEGQAEDTF